jgi:hypothetical protein
VLCPYLPKKKIIARREGNFLELYLNLATQLAFL